VVRIRLEVKQAALGSIEVFEGFSHKLGDHRRIALELQGHEFRTREGGWLLISLCALYQALGDDDLFHAARRVLDGIRLWLDEGAPTLLPPAQWVFSPVHLFIALTGVADLWRLTGDREAERLLARGGEMALERGRTEAGFFFIADGPAYRSTGRWPTCHSLPVLSALYDVTGERKWVEVGVQQAALMLRQMEHHTGWQQEQNWAQGGIFLAYAFGFFHTAARLGLLRDLGPS